MRFPPSILDEIRTRLPVSAVVGRRVKLQKAGREFKGLSPFNAEKTPSFTVNDQKGFFHCFSSGKHGDIFRFVMETEGLSFYEAVEKLAQDAGVTLPKISAETQAQENKRNSLYEVMDLAQRFYQAQLHGPAAAQARAYLLGRGLGPEVWERFGMGYASAERFALRDHLAAKGVGADLMLQAGLLVSGDEIKVPFDKFRQRVMFPIADQKGRVIAFGGRALDKDAPAKYLNSPETPLFHKGEILFNHHTARKAAHERGRVIAVEGYVDVISLSVAGVTETVAPLGTALTEAQMTLLWRMAEEPILCFDGDKAGKRAAYRALETALPLLRPGQSLRFALLPEGQDPDDLARSGGSRAVEEVLGRSLSFADMLWMREVETHPLDTPERRAAFERDLRILLKQVQDEDVRRHYRAEFDKRLAELMPSAAPRQAGTVQGGGRSQRGGAGLGGRMLSRGGRGRTGGSGLMPLHDAFEPPVRASPLLAQTALFGGKRRISAREAFIVICFLRFPVLLQHHADALSSLDVESGTGRRLISVLLDFAGQTEDLSRELLEKELDSLNLTEEVEALTALVSTGDRRCLEQAERSVTGSIDIAGALHQAMILHRRALTLHKELMAAERALAEDGTDTALAVIRDLQLQLSALDGMEAERDRLGVWAAS